MASVSPRLASRFARGTPRFGTVGAVLFMTSTLAAFASCPWEARADDTIKHPGDHLPYYVEIEPHLALAYGDWSSGLGGSVGYGVGGRFSIPLVKNGFIPSINNSVAIGVGIDFLHFGCNEAFGNADYGCSLNSLSFPVVMQWNFYVSKEWSVFGEPGIFLYHQFFDNEGKGCFGGCPGITSTSVLPAFYVGGRYRFNDRIALTMRVGYPTVNIGVSFFD